MNTNRIELAVTDYADPALIHLNHPTILNVTLCGRPWQPWSPTDPTPDGFCPECNSTHTLCIHCGQRVYDGGEDGWVGEGDDESLYCPKSHRLHGPAMPEYPSTAPRWGFFR